jgi:hypothetical protein
MKTAILIAAAFGVVSLAGAAWADEASEAQLQSQLAAAQAELAQYKDALGKANAAIAQANADREQAKASQTAAAQSLEYCQAKNVYLIALGGQILDRYKKVNLGTVMGVREPFTGLMRVRLENAQQEYEDKVRAGRFDPRLDRPVAAAGGQAPAPEAAQTPAPTPPGG